MMKSLQGDNSPPTQSSTPPKTHLNPLVLIPKPAYLFIPSANDCYKPHPDKKLQTYRYIFQGSTQLLPHELKKIEMVRYNSSQIDSDRKFWSDGLMYRFMQNKDNTLAQDISEMIEYYRYRKNLENNLSTTNYINNIENIEKN